MESKKKKPARKASKSKTPAKTKKKEQKISFKSWFANKVRDKRLNFWQESEIQIFFKSKGLSDVEEPERYEESLRLY